MTEDRHEETLLISPAGPVSDGATWGFTLLRGLAGQKDQVRADLVTATDQEVLDVLREALVKSAENTPWIVDIRAFSDDLALAHAAAACWPDNFRDIPRQVIAADAANRRSS